MEQGVLIEIGLPVSLFLIMIGMGMTLTPKDFHEVIVAPRATLFGLLAQVLLLPLVAFGLAMVLPLTPALAVGLIVIAACPGGSTSNLFAYLGRGDVALSIVLFDQLKVGDRLRRRMAIDIAARRQEFVRPGRPPEFHIIVELVLILFIANDSTQTLEGKIRRIAQ